VFLRRGRLQRVHHDCGVQWSGRQRVLHCVCCWERVRRGCGATCGVLLLAWVCVDLDVVKRMRGRHRHVCHGRLRPGQRVRWWDGATGRLHMQPRLRLNLHDDDRVCGNHGHLHRLWCRLELRREWRASSTLFLLRRICLDGHYVNCLRHNIRDMHAGQLRRGECVRRRDGAACRMRLLPWCL
jgi:hypothetical protein